jgi:hypothetical protein
MEILAFLAKIRRVGKKIYVFLIHNGAQDSQIIFNSSRRVTENYRRMTLKKYILYIIIIPYLAVCVSSVYAQTDIEIVMNGKLPYDKSMTIGDAFNKFRYFESKAWRFRQEENKEKLVIFIGKLDLRKLSSYNNILNALQAAFIRVIFALNTDNSIDVKSVSYQIRLPKEFKLMDYIMDTPDSFKDSVINIYKNDSKSGLIITKDLVKAFPLLER